jgi:MoxR-like ATPase
MSQIKIRIEKILNALNENIHEREETLSVALLSALADQNIFLYGPPGTAKSLISRRLAKVFKSKNYFEYLMQKFSTPDEVFGPVSIKELKNDNYERKTDGYLPNAEFAFLDEIWKSSPAILNTLLTLINEKKFKNGNEIKEVPLKVLISASNETPPHGQGLEALYDRFTTRLYVPPMESKENFELLLQNGGSSDEVDIDENLRIKTSEWNKWKQEIQEVKISDEVFNIVNAIRLEFEKRNKKKNFDLYVSDRRWQKALTLVKAGAYFCDRRETNIVDALLLSHTLWTTKDNKDEVIKIVEEAVRESGFDTGYSLKSLDDEKEKLEQEINKELLYSSDVYDTVKLDRNTQYFEVVKQVEKRYGGKENIEFYIPYKKMKTKDNFHPIDSSGNEIKWLKCSFKTQGSCDIQYNGEGRDNSYYLDSNYWNELPSYKPKVLFRKGDKKEEVNERLVEALKQETEKLSKKIEQLIKETEAKEENFLKELDTPFVAKEKISIAIESVEKQIDDLKLRHKDTDRLKELVG